MTTGAAAVSFEHDEPARRVTGGHRLRVEVAHIANEGDNRGELSGIQPTARHRRAGKAVGNDPHQVVVGRGVAEAATPKVDARNLIAGRAMALRALRRVHDRPGLDIGLRVLARMLRAGRRDLLRGESTGQGEKKTEAYCGKCRTSVDPAS